MSCHAVEASTLPLTWNCSASAPESLPTTREKAMEEFKPSAVSRTVAEEDITAARLPQAMRLPDIGATEIVAHAARRKAMSIAAVPTGRLFAMAGRSHIATMPPVADKIISTCWL